MGTCSTILLVIVTIFFPPLGVFLVAGCGADILINICLTILGYFPGHIHAFYIEYTYYQRQHDRKLGVAPVNRAPAIFSERVQGGGTQYGTVPV
ncbi:plasma membrane proteolipid 3 [Trichophaea hybrida]|nr:plasma membrane proteolipid 3 [Trichophaea hybrida]